jgi:hypothetical protein
MADMINGRCSILFLYSIKKRKISRRHLKLCKSI